MGRFDKFKNDIEKNKDKLVKNIKKQKEENFNEETFDKLKNDLGKNKNKIIENINEQKKKRENEKKRKEEEEERKRKEKWEKDKPLIIKSGVFLIIALSALGILSLFTDDKDEKEIENKTEQVVEEKIEEAEKQEEKEIKKTVENESEEKEEVNAIAESIYKDAIGKMAFETHEDLEQEGFTVKFIHASSKQDFTTAVQFESDPSDAETYIPWVITELDSFDLDKKTASFYINNEENIERQEENENAERILTNKLHPTDAWTALKMRGEKEFPAGFKLKMVTGTLAEEAIDEDTWFLKANCDVINSAGVRNKNAVCEAEITGTNDAPKVISFNVYNP